MMSMIRRAMAAVLILLTAPLAVRAEVTRVDVVSRADVGLGYEKIVGRVHFAVDPKDPRNRVVVDLDKAPRNAEGRVEFTADLYLLKPKTTTPDGVALVDIVNRGRKTVLSGFNRATGPGANDPATEADLGDGFLMRRGFTIVCVGWEFDVARQAGAMRIEVPVVTEGGKPLTGVVRAQFTPNQRESATTVGDLAGYQPADPNSPDSTLTVRDGLTAAWSTIPRDRWQLAGNVVTLDGGFAPGKIYELAYRAASLPIGGLGFVAVRDVATWVKHEPGALASAKYLYAFGSSQSGRFLRTFVYQGFNADERRRQVLDGVIANIAGSARLDLNGRAATPTGLAMYTATAFPFAVTAERDPVTGVSDGLLDNDRARAHQPKMFFTNTGVEYWGGGRTAALAHTAPDGTRDLALPDNVRTYFFAGTQHSPGAFPPGDGLGQQPGNPLDYWWTLRALMVAMDRWVREGAAPPKSQHPLLSERTLVKAIDAAFPNLPHVQSPQMLKAGTRAANELLPKGGGGGAPLPLLVPQVDADGNETSGVRLPDLVAPLATYTGWNFRKASIGGTDRLYPLIGSYIPFARTKAEREQRRDPRPSIEERYPTREKYMSLVAAAAASLVKSGYLLADDVSKVEERSGRHWEWALAGQQ